VNILLVEDHDQSRTVLSNLLTDCGHEVLMAANVREALVLLSDLRCDVLVSAIGLPDGSGLELLAEAKRRQPWKKTVALTTHAQPEEKELGLGSGFDAYLTKPFDFNRLRSLLAETPSP
jgi:CheY-like chemotaxis protein